MLQRLIVLKQPYYCEFNKAKEKFGRKSLIVYKNVKQQNKLNKNKKTKLGIMTLSLFTIFYNLKFIFSW